MELERAMIDVAVLVDDMYEELELWYPYHRLREAGFSVALVGPEIRTYQGRFGYPATASHSSESVQDTAFAGVVIPGGYAPDRMRRDPALVEIVRSTYRRGGIIAAICHAGWMLAEADIARGHQLTCFFSIKQDLINAGGIYRDESVVVDRNLITSRSPEDLPDFGAALVRALKEA